MGIFTHMQVSQKGHFSSLPRIQAIKGRNRHENLITNASRFNHQPVGERFYHLASQARDHFKGLNESKWVPQAKTLLQ